MRIRSYFSTVMFVFLVVAIGHFIRAVTGTVVMVGHMVVPLWASWVAVVVALYLCYQSYKLGP